MSFFLAYINTVLIYPSRMELTEKQKAVLELLIKAARRGEPMPTFREIAKTLGVDVRAAYQHIEALEKKEIVIRRGGQRGLELAPEFAPPVGVPVIGRVAAGLPILAEENIDDYVDIKGAAGDEDLFLLKVKGDSMVDRHIFNGDFVLVRPQPRLDNGDIGVVAVNGEATVKEVHVMRDRVILVSHNTEKAYPDQVYNKSNEVRIVGKVVMAFRFIN